MKKKTTAIKVKKKPPEVFQCLKCSQDFNKIRTLLDHIENDHLSKPDDFLDEWRFCNQFVQVSPACGFSTLDNKLFIEHIDGHFGHLRHQVQHHPENVRLFCTKCQMDFKLCLGLASHLKSVKYHPKSSLHDLKCQDFFNDSKLDSQCDQTCQSRLELIKHIKGHLKVLRNLQTLQCEKCDQTFSKVYHLQRHVRQFHLGIKPIRHNKVPDKATCHLCGEEFYSKSTLKSHIMSKHEKIKPFICELCGKGSMNLALHSGRNCYI